MRFTRGRRRQVDTTGHFCPYVTCSYHGWVDWGNIRANGHPHGRRWRQLVCLGCHGYFLETVDTPFHGKQVDTDKLVWAMAALAEGLGIRAVARVFETDPTTVLRWLVEAAEHLEAFTHYHLCDLHVEQVQMDERFALLSAVQEGEVTEAQAIKRLSRSPHWVGVAMDPYIAGSHGVVTVPLEVVQKGDDVLGVKIGQVQLGHITAAGVGHEASLNFPVFVAGRNGQVTSQNPPF